MNDKDNAQKQENGSCNEGASSVAYLACVFILLAAAAMCVYTMSPINKLYDELHDYSDGSSVYNTIEHKKMKKALDQEFGKDFDWDFKQYRRDPDFKHYREAP